MGGTADAPQRSSSPLKRRASSMDPELDNADGGEDVDMITAPAAQLQEEDLNQGSVQDNASIPLETSTEADLELPLRNDVPPLDQQVKIIETLVKAFAETPLKEGHKAYLLSRQWLSRAQAFGADAKHTSKEAPGRALGPVDNSDIIQTIFTDSNGQHCVQLRPGMGTENFELFPEEAWSLLLSWYGLAQGQSEIVRTAHNTAPDAVSAPNIQFEFHPPIFTIHRLWSAMSPIPVEQELKQKKPAPPVVMQSTSFGYHNFLKQAKQLARVADDKKVRVWRILQTLPTAEQPARASGIGTPPDSPGRVPAIASRPPRTPGAFPEMLVDVETFLALEKDVERALVDAEDTTTNSNYNGKKSLSLVGLTVDQTLVLDEYVDRDSNVSTYRGSSNKDRTLATRGSSSSLATQTRPGASGRNSPALPGPLTRGRAQQKSGRTIGCCGLQNLGNTCYMNSALQCVRSVEELTKYFLTREAEKEINTENPLSHNGDVAMAYGRLLLEIYKDPPPNSVQPRQFKSVIGRYAPAFSGYGQQDSQEFLGFLLDGLQEDLNRIKKKPYIEKPDSTDEMIGNLAAIREMAEKVWDITKKRDDSVIADLFTGMYQSTLVCPECDKVSITFDPFNNLTLPLPIGGTWTKSIKYFPLNDTPVILDVEIDKNSSIKDLKKYFSARVGVPVERLFAAEVFRDKFYKFYDDTGCMSEEIQTNDIVTMHELEAPPSSAATVRGPKKQPRYRSLLSADTPEEALPWGDFQPERLLVPVVHRLNPEGYRKPHYGTRKQSNTSLPEPHFIVLTREEAQDEDIIRRKILEKMATYSTWAEFVNANETDTSETTDPEIVNNTSDADSAGDTNVVAKSVEGEEDIVDVTMSDAADGPKAASTAATEQYPILLKCFNSRRPKWVNPAEFLDPQFQNLFELSYYSDGGGAMPTGWQSINDDTIFPRLATRQAKPVVVDVEMRSPGPWDGSDDTGSEGQSSNVHEQTRMADESDEDSDLPDLRHLAQRSTNPSLKSQVSVRGRKKMKAYKTHGKKGKKRFEKQQRAALANRPNDTESEDASGPDGGPLVRLGEGIVVDWNENAYDIVFGGTSPNEMRGMKTFKELETLVDPALEARKKQRQLRQRNGISLDDCLAEFEKAEVLSEQDTWYCPRCKEHRRATKKFDLWKTPDILVVHLKRFSSSGWRRDKIDALVDFPIEGLDLTNRVIDKTDGKQEIYDLIAVDNHWGGLGGGHYTACAKNFIDGEWYEYNDASVSKQRDPSKAVTAGAYLLFYRRRSEIPLGGPRFQDIAERFNAQNEEDELASGEGRRLGQGSSLRGSPSASTGADLTLPRGNRGLASTADTGADRQLPTYQASLGRVGEADDDADMRTQLPWSQQGPLRSSIEADGDDEAVDLPDYKPGPMASMTSVIGKTENWSFEKMKGGFDAVVDDEIASDVAQGDGSSINEDPFADDTEPMLLEEPGSSYIEPPEPLTDFSAFDDPPAPVPRDQNFMTRVVVEAWEEQVHTVPADMGDDQPSEQVTEIRIDDDHEQGPSKEQQHNPSA